MISTNFFISQIFFSHFGSARPQLLCYQSKIFTDCRQLYGPYTLWKLHTDSIQIVISMNFFISQKYFCILDRLGLNFYAINLRFSPIVDNHMAYYLWKFHIDSLQIVISTNFVISQKCFRILFTVQYLRTSFMYSMKKWNKTKWPKDIPI